MNDKLSTILEAVLTTEAKVIPLFVHNPQSQAIAGVAMVGEQILFNLISQLHASHVASASAQVAAGAAPAK